MLVPGEQKRVPCLALSGWKIGLGREKIRGPTSVHSATLTKLYRRAVSIHLQPTSMKNSIRIIWLIIAVFVILFIIVFSLPANRYLFYTPICSEKATLRKLSINAIAIEKFKDHHSHNYNTVKFKDISTRSTFDVYFINEDSGFFNNVIIGDTIIKNSGSLEFKSSNPCLVSPFKFNCENQELK